MHGEEEKQNNNKTKMGENHEEKNPTYKLWTQKGAYNTPNDHE